MKMNIYSLNFNFLSFSHLHTHAVFTIKKYYLSIKWIGSYIKNRNQLVALNGSQYKPLIESMGVHQVSILGPLLFILFINDFPISNNKYDTLIYADDILIYFPITNDNYEQITNNINK